MKFLMILTIGVCLLFSAVPAMANQAEDGAAIRKLVKQIHATANKHDAKAYAALCAENFESWDGTAKGRAAWGKLVSDLWGSQKDIQYKLLNEIGIIFVTPDVAIYKGVDEVTGSLDADGKPLPPQKELRARIFVKKNGTWLYAAYFSA